MAKPKDKRPKFEVHYKAVETKTAVVQADNMRDALEIVSGMSLAELDDLPGDPYDSEHIIEAIFKT